MHNQSSVYLGNADGKLFIGIKSGSQNQGEQCWKNNGQRAEKAFRILCLVKTTEGFYGYRAGGSGTPMRGGGTMRQRNSGEYKNRLQYMENRLNTKNRKIKMAGSLAVL